MPIFARQAYATGIELTPLLALRFVMAAAMLWALVLLRRRPLGSPRGLVLGAAARLRRLRRAGRPLLRRDPAHRRRARVAAALRLPLARHRSPPSRCAASRRPAASSARSRSPRAASCSCSPAAARARSTGSAPPWRSPAPASTPSSSSAPSARRRRRPPSRSPQRRHRRRGHVRDRGAASPAACTRAARACMWAAVIAVFSTVIPIVLFIAGPRARRRLHRRDRLDGRARDDGRARLDRARRDARAAPARRRRARALRRRPAAAAPACHDAAMAYVVSARWLAHGVARSGSPS